MWGRGVGVGERGWGRNRGAGGVRKKRKLHRGFGAGSSVGMGVLWRRGNGKGGGVGKRVWGAGWGGSGLEGVAWAGARGVGGGVRCGCEKTKKK